MSGIGSGRQPFAFIPGESFNGAVARWAANSWIERMVDVTCAAGISSRVRQTAAGADEDAIRALAAEMEVDPEELLIRATPKVDGGPGFGTRLFCGLRVPTAMVEGFVRRHAPAAFLLPNGRHHRALWDLRLLPVCAQTGQPLQERCWSETCVGRRVGWQRTFGIATCEHCMGDLSSAHVDPIPTALLNAYRPIARLFDPVRRPDSLALLPPSLSTDGGQLAADLLIRLVRVVDPAVGHDRRGLHREDPVRACEALVRAWDMMKGWPNAFHDLALARMLARTKRHDDGNGGQTVRFLKIEEGPTVSPGLAALVAPMRDAIHLRGPDGAAIAATTCRIKEASVILGLGTAEVAQLRRNRSLRSVLVIDDDRPQPVFDRAELVALAAAIASRQGFDFIASRLGISHHGVEQLADMGLIDVHDHPFHLDRYGVLQSTAASFGSLQSDLASRQAAALPKVKVSLRQAMKRVGGRRKPWGPAFRELLGRRVPYLIAPGGKPLTQRILIAASDAPEIAALAFRPSVPVRFAFADMMSKQDAGETLNLAAKQCTEHFASVPTKVGQRAKSLPVADVLATAARSITPTEVAARLGTSAQSAYARLRAEGVPSHGIVGFCRTTAEEALSL